jgi:hypothetical protein
LFLLPLVLLVLLLLLLLLLLLDLWAGRPAEYAGVHWLPKQSTPAA